MSEARFKWLMGCEPPVGQMVCTMVGPPRVKTGSIGAFAVTGGITVVPNTPWMPAAEARAAIDFAIEAEKLLNHLLEQIHGNKQWHDDDLIGECKACELVLEISKLLEAKP